MNFVTAGLALLTCKSVPNEPPNHPGEGDDVRGGTDHNDQGRWNQPPT